jgi:hypothetical protein
VSQGSKKWMRRCKFEPKLVTENVLLYGDNVGKRICSAFYLALMFHYAEGSFLLLEKPEAHLKTYRDLRHVMIRMLAFMAGQPGRPLLYGLFISEHRGLVTCNGPVLFDKNQCLNLANLLLVPLTMMEYGLCDAAQRGLHAHKTTASIIKALIAALSWILMLPCRLMFLPVAVMNRSVVGWRESTLLAAKQNSALKSVSSPCRDRFECGVAPIAAVSLLLASVFVGLLAEGRKLGFDLVSRLHVHPLPDALEAARPVIAGMALLVIVSFGMGVVRALCAPRSNLRHFFSCGRAEQVGIVDGEAALLGGTSMDANANADGVPQGCCGQDRRAEVVVTMNAAQGARDLGCG